MIGSAFDDHGRPDDLLGWLAQLEALFDVADAHDRVPIELAAEFWRERRAIHRMAVGELPDTAGTADRLGDLERRLRDLARPEGPQA